MPVLNQRSSVLLLVVLSLWRVFAGEPSSVSPPVLPSDPEQAWAELNKLHEVMRPPEAWRGKSATPEEVAQFQKAVREAAHLYFRRAREFAARYPTNENAPEARVMAVYALTHGIAAGDASAAAEMDAYVQTVLADRSLPEDDRAAVLLYAGNAPFMKNVGMRYFTVGMQNLNEEFERNSVDAMRAALKQFPTNSMIYTMMVAVAQRSPPERQRALAQEISGAEDAPPGAKALAYHLLKGTRPYEIGRSLDIKFTALDGQEVDLAKLRGKVVLVEFWSTTCGPCIGELPHLKAAYEKFHDRGFEIVGISLDDKESALRRFIADKKLPWPQHFDGKGWENQFAVRYGIFAIPTTWLVDKRGNLRNTQARGAPEAVISTLLAEKE